MDIYHSFCRSLHSTLLVATLVGTGAACAFAAGPTVGRSGQTEGLRLCAELLHRASGVGSDQSSAQAGPKTCARAGGSAKQQVRPPAAAL
ncbi:MAG TPA: hypothetical protein VHL31_10015 [Geminicoccus sp.]|jgi:hypothetical protein|uniref:hypothetical protein n=1 Tax=Geminicoccus sp. TaxID=2024832 RepID=UPI002E33AF0D|nr:hypothetical protein [Geminicoccus sp.]HEX2526615.1 hypothetical protein [Geminicoccus sp.]